MKKILFTVMVALLSMAGCQKEYDDSALWDQVNSQAKRIAALEAWQATVSGNISALETLVNSLRQHRFITSVEQFTDPAPGGWYIHTSTAGTPPDVKTFTIYNGADGEDGDDAPLIGVKELDGVYYWTLDGEWLYKPGSDPQEKIPVTGNDGITPKLRINAESNNWEMCTTGVCKTDEEWTEVLDDHGNPIKATGAPGDAIFANDGIIITEDYVEFTLADGVTKIKLPTYAAFEALKTLVETANENISALEGLVNSLQQHRFITNVEPFTEPAPGGWKIHTTTAATPPDAQTYIIRNGADGADGDDAPLVGVRELDGVYYWTLDGDWLYKPDSDPQEKIPVTGNNGITPKLRINAGTNNWEMCTTGVCETDAEWSEVKDSQGYPVKATGAPGDAIFANDGITITADYVEFTLADGVNKITLPTYAAFEALKSLVETANQNISALQTLVGGKLFITSVEPFTEPAPGGWYINTINTEDTPVTGKLTIYNGENGADAPLIGVEALEGVYYWTLDGDWLYKPGSSPQEKIPVTGNNGITTQLRINADSNNWEMCTTGDCEAEGEWSVVLDDQGDPVKATGAQGDAIFKKDGITITADYVEFTLANGTTKIKLPTYAAFEALKTLVETANTNISALQTLVGGKLFITSVESFTNSAQGGWHINTINTANPPVTGVLTIHNGTNGTNGNNAEFNLVVAQDTETPADLTWYWQLNGEWVTDGAENKIPATGANGTNGDDGKTPQVAIGEDDTDVGVNYWFINADGSATSPPPGAGWVKTTVKATGATGPQGPSIFATDGVNNENPAYVVFKLADQTEIKVSRYRPLGIAFNNTPDLIRLGEKLDIDATVSGIYGAPAEITAVDVPRGWSIKFTNPASDVTGDYVTKITVTAPKTSAKSYAVTGTAKIFVSDGVGRTIFRVLNVETDRALTGELVDDETVIGEEERFVVPEGSSLIIESGQSLEVKGELEILGELEVESGGELKVESGVLTVEGTVAVASGGTITAPALNADGSAGDSKIDFGPDGKVVLQKGSTGYYGEVPFIGANSSGSIYEWDGSSGTVTLTEGVTEVTAGIVIAKQSTGIPPETKIAVASGASLTTSESTTFTIAGTLEVDGAFTMVGAIDVPDGGEIEVKSGGTYVLAFDGEGTNNGTVRVKSGGVTVGKGGVVTGDGYNVIEAGGKAIYDRDDGDNPPAVTVIGTDGTAVFNLSEGEMWFNNDSYILKGTGTLNHSFALDAEPDNTLVVESGAALTVANNATLDVSEGVLTVAGSVTVASGGIVKAPALGADNKVVFENGAGVVLEKGATGYYGNYLYVSSGADGVYQWGSDNAKITMKGSNVTEVTAGTVTAIKNAAIPAGTSIEIKSGAAITTAADITYEIGGTLNVNGLFQLEGALDVKSGGVINVESGATYVLAFDGTGTNNGTVRVKDGGVTVGKGGVVTGDGYNVVEAGGKAIYDRDGAPAAVTVIGTASDADAVFKLSSGEMWFRDDRYILKGTGTLSQSFRLNIDRNKTLQVASGFALTIASGVVLIGEVNTEVQNYGTITVSGDNSNFYSEGVTTPTPPVGTYKWNANAGGTDIAGWKTE